MASRCASDQLGDEVVVISGMAGRFPASDNVREFAENLYNKKLLTTTDHRRHDPRRSDLPATLGVVNNCEKFDAPFFSVSTANAEVMDPMSRMFLEHSFEAILDAGVNPMELRGGNTGVFLGCCFSHAESFMRDPRSEETGLSVVGTNRSTFANRVSFHLDVHGPSFSVDTACSSALAALEFAYKAIKSGECDSAIVGGCNMCHEVLVSRMFYKLGVLSKTNLCRCFDADADGYVRAEAVGAIFLQRERDAKRVYATVVHAKSNNDGYKALGFSHPSRVTQAELLQQTYDECGLSPKQVTYVEAHMTGTKAGDPEELEAMDTIYSPGRTRPLFVGSVKANMGHAEGAAALCSIVKTLILMENNLIPPNINYNNPRTGVECLEKGRLLVATEPTPWEGGYVGINSYGFGGANVHAILKPNPKEKPANISEIDDLPRLVLASGRTEEAVASILDDVNSRPVDPEYIRLLHDIFADDISGHLYRGYTLTNLPSEDQFVSVIDHNDGGTRPIWYVFSGMGSQWPGMGTNLLRFPVFAEAIKKCDAALKPHGVDVTDIITNPDPKNFDNILRSFVGITAVQIGLVDLLKSIGILPDKIIGHSFGELGCAYADGCLTVEETILCSYKRGLASIETDHIPGAMVAVSLGYKQVKDICPSDIDIACHNASDSCTISGPAESIRNFIDELQAKGIMAKEVPCGNIAYHGRYIVEVGKKLLVHLREVIKTPRRRTSKWLSTSVPQAEWYTPVWKLSSAEYHTHNLLSPVLFEETMELIPVDAIVVEIAPHGLLQPILKRTLGQDVLNVQLSHWSQNNAQTLLEGLGQLYNVGCQPKIARLYPDVEFPVSRGTPSISPLIKWEHSADWDLPSAIDHVENTSVKTYKVGVSNAWGKSMDGHIIQGKPIVPATGYLALVWDLCSSIRDEKNVPVVFEDVMFNRATFLPEKGNVLLTVTIEESTEKFCVTESNVAVVTGIIRVPRNVSDERIPKEYLAKIDDPEEMDTTDVYKELQQRGYHYSGEFRAIQSCSVTGTKAHVMWEGNWISFLDGILQTMLVQQQSRELCVPTGIRKIVIDTAQHYELINELCSAKPAVPATYHEDLRALVCGGVEICDVSVVYTAGRKEMEVPVIQEHRFVANRDGEEVSRYDAVSMFVNLALENVPMLNVRAVELIDDRDDLASDDLASPLIVEVLNKVIAVRGTSTLIANPERFAETDLPEGVVVAGLSDVPKDIKTLIAFGYDLLKSDRAENLKLLMDFVHDEGFIVTCENGEYVEENAKIFGHDVIMQKRVENRTMLLLRKSVQLPEKIVTIRIDNYDLSWIEDMKRVLNDITEDFRLVVVGESFDSGLMGFLNSLRQEFREVPMRGVLVRDSNAPKFSLDDPFYAEQLKLDLVFNVFQNNAWGTYRHLPMPPIERTLVPHCQIKQKIHGDFGSLTWMEGPLRDEFDTDNNIVYIHYSSLNFRDVMIASGKMQNSVSLVSSDEEISQIGYEYSGVDKAGNRVMGIAFGRCLANRREKTKNFVFAVPEEWSLEDAATVPVVYGTCYYAFYVIGSLRRGDKVLIHAGSGAVGQAAIHVALHEDCEVFVTVGSAEKRQFIRENFPSIDDDHIGSSRDGSFEQTIMRQTNGRGVDVVLNSLAGDKLHASMRCLADYGQFLEIGQFDILSNSQLGMKTFANGITFRPVMFDLPLVKGSRDIPFIEQLLYDGIKKGVVKPLVRTVFDKDEIEHALRYMAAGKHIGKVLLKLRNEGDPLSTPILAQPRYYCQKDASYVLFGSLGGFGLELVDWLIERGAKKLVLVSRSAMKNGYQRRKLKYWKSRNIETRLIIGKDVSNRQDVESILKTAEEMGPVDGVFNLILSLADRMFDNQTVESFQELLKGKAWLTKILDELTRRICPKLRHFVVFSSVSSGYGNIGQTNYGMANSVMERICERRVRDGLHGLAIQWGFVGDVGAIVESDATVHTSNHLRLLPQKMRSCLEELDGFLLRDRTVVSTMVLAEKRKKQNTRTLIDAVQSIMGLKDLKYINMQATLPELGIDSIVAVEIKETLEREFETFLTAQLIRNLTFAELYKMNKGSTTRKARKVDAPVATIKPTNVLYIDMLIGNDDDYTKVCIDLPNLPLPGRSRVFFIPGIEGSWVAFKQMAKYIKSPATCLQIDLYQNPDTNLSFVESANDLLPHLLSLNEGRKDFNIVGYSYGSGLAIELARKLENMGLTAKLVLIDGAPHLMKSVERKIFATEEAEKQSRFFVMMLNNMAPFHDVSVEVELRKRATFKEKMRVVINCLIASKVHIPCSEETLQKVFECIYKRTISIEKYDIENAKPIKAPITLLRTVQNVTNVPEVDYGLDKITESSVELHFIPGNHTTILNSLKVARIINNDKHIDESKDDTM